MLQRSKLQLLYRAFTAAQRIRDLADASLFRESHDQHASLIFG